MEEEKDKTVDELENNASDNAPKKSKRDILIERVRAKYPDDDYDADEDLLYGRLGELGDGYEKELSDMKANNDKVYGFLKENPELGAAFAAIRGGEHPIVAMRKYFGDDDFDIKEGSEHHQAYMAAKAERKKAAEERERFLEELEANRKLSEDNLRAYAEENHLSDEDIEELTKQVYGDIDSMGRGLISKDYWGRMRKAYSHDEDVQNALAAGEIKGRNEQIDSSFRKGGDGLPEMRHGGTPKEEEAEEDYSTKRLRELNEKIDASSKWGGSGYKKKN